MFDDARRNIRIKHDVTHRGQSGKVSVPGGIDVREEIFELLIRAENPFLRHILY